MHRRQGLQIEIASWAGTQPERLHVLGPFHRLARNNGKPQAHAGEIVTAKVDFAEINDLYLQTIYSFYEMGGEKVWDSERAAFVFDHYAP